MHRLKSIFARTRHGVSLLELLIGLGILLAISAIVIPWTTGWLGTRELDNAEDGLTMQMMMARAAAREGGRAVEVVEVVPSAGDERYMKRVGVGRVNRISRRFQSNQRR